MNSYTKAADYYDLLHAADKDYANEAQVIANLVRQRSRTAQRVLDVVCGTGRHAAELTARGFTVDGLDLEPQFVASAATRNPDGRFVVADMTRFELSAHYDAIVCLFSAIGYVVTVGGLNETLVQMARHLASEGTVIIDPWFEPGQLSNGRVEASAHVREGLAVCRVSRTFVEGVRSRLEFDYLIARANGVEHLAETHILGLFTQGQIEAAFHQAGLTVQRHFGILRKRGVYIGHHRASAP